MCTVRQIHADKIARLRIFVVPGDDPALQGMPEIELLDILKIICEVVGGQQGDGKFDFQTIQLVNAHSCKAYTDWEIKSDNAKVVEANSHMPDYYGSSMNITEDKRTSQA